MCALVKTWYCMLNSSSIPQLQSLYIMGLYMPTKGLMTIPPFGKISQNFNHGTCECRIFYESRPQKLVFNGPGRGARPPWASRDSWSHRVLRPPASSSPRLSALLRGCRPPHRHPGGCWRRWCWVSTMRRRSSPRTPYEIVEFWNLQKLKKWDKERELPQSDGISFNKHPKLANGSHSAGLVIIAMLLDFISMFLDVWF